MINNLTVFLVFTFVLFFINALEQIYYLGKLVESSEETYQKAFDKNHLIINFIVFLLWSIWIIELLGGS